MPILYSVGSKENKLLVCKRVGTYALEVVAVEPGGLALELSAEANGLAGAAGLPLAGFDSGDEGDDQGHEEDGELSELHGVYLGWRGRRGG